ncbi:MAG: N-acetylmuramoyl-L-alanine amidase [Lysobacterales bacterium]
MPGAHPRHLSYISRLDQRERNDIDLVVIHCTELPDLAMAREFGERIHYPDSATGNSGHFYIDRDGRAEEWVPIDRIAHHADVHNERSVGIELVNRGRYPDWYDSRRQELTEPYPQSQILSLVRLLTELEEALPSLTWVTGHEHLDQRLVAASDDPTRTVPRKRDPGPMFPWEEVLDQVTLRLFDIRQD